MWTSAKNEQIFVAANNKMKYIPSSPGRVHSFHIPNWIHCQIRTKDLFRYEYSNCWIALREIVSLLSEFSSISILSPTLFFSLNSIEFIVVSKYYNETGILINTYSVAHILTGSVSVLKFSWDIITNLDPITQKIF